MAEQGGERLLKVAHRDAAQVEIGNSASRLRVRRARRGRIAEVKRMRSAPSPGAAVTQFHSSHLDRADPGLDHPLRDPGRAGPCVRPSGSPASVIRARNASASASTAWASAGGRRSSGRTQRILDRVGLTERDNSAIARLGVSLLQEFRQASTRLDTPPFSNRHHPVSRIAHALRGMSSPRQSHRLGVRGRRHH